MKEDDRSHHFATITQKTKQRWKVRKDGDTRKTVEIVHLGQQTLRRV
jgi:hypothetical protein